MYIQAAMRMVMPPTAPQGTHYPQTLDSFLQPDERSHPGTFYVYSRSCSDRPFSINAARTAFAPDRAARWRGYIPLLPVCIQMSDLCAFTCVQHTNHGRRLYIVRHKFNYMVCSGLDPRTPIISASDPDIL